MRWLSLLAILFITVFSMAQQPNVKEKDKLAAEQAFLTIDKIISYYANFEFDGLTRAALEKLPTLISRKGLVVTTYLPEYRQKQGKSVIVTTQKQQTIPIEAIEKVVGVKIKMIDDYFANKEESYISTPANEMIDNIFRQYQFQKPEKFLPLRKDIAIWAWQPVTTAYINSKQPIPCRVKLVKESNVWKLAELQIVSDERLRGD